MSDKIARLEDLDIKDGFVERYKSLTGDAYDDFMSCSLTFLRRSIRVNTLKISIKDLKKRLEKNWVLDPIPWANNGFWIRHREGNRRDIGNLKEHQLGYFHVQEAASMLPPLVLLPKPGELVLDMCASPGSKTTQMAVMMENKGLLVANDFKGLRIRSLGINLFRAGITNTITTLMDGRRFKDLLFDKILVDAPCSGTGTIRKSLKTLRIWNAKGITRLAKTQAQLLEAAFQNLRPGGELVYSTCSLEPEENEGIISDFLLNHDDVEVLNIDLDLVKGDPVLEFEGKEYNPEVKKTLRIWPQDNDTEGFFVAKLKKL